MTPSELYNYLLKLTEKELYIRKVAQK